ncbi:precorrin-6A synthase (deacetylating) [Pseudonocardia spinosispora]|uniref:precorrin-6A synthase (deacetylating) n=1 Tax=Pseudonocardia spinosispora TaxID=103441 RepID=UPI00048E2179|nr:precorrin-6A synthase (deacetylating) [Pseudonocardia spinosispora]
MRTVLAIGVGAGDPELLTVQAVEALNRVDVFFVFDKGESGADLDEARRAILLRHAPGEKYRVVEVPDPRRDRQASAYTAAVTDWRDERAARLERAIETELTDGGVGAILVWGDPALYDGTIRILDTIIERGVVELDHRVIPGISSIQLLAAHHRVPLNQVAGSVVVTPGRLLARQLARGLDDTVTDIVVMLDAELVCTRLRGQGFTIYWGAYLGSDDEVLIAGELDQVVDDIVRTRRELRERKGWIMDSYLLRRART